MDIVSRLKIFLQESGISNSIFADNCGIPRPTLSQLLNGRNKKVSDELISKIHSAYPALNVMWLMFGDGEMIVPNANSLMSGTNSQPVDNSIEFNSPVADSNNAVRKNTINFGNTDSGEYNDSSRKPQASSSASATMAALQNMVRSASAMGKASSQRGNAQASAGESRVVNIMVFYSDGRFESFVPQG